MKTLITMSKTDTENHKEDIVNLLNDIKPYAEEFFNHFGVKPTEMVYDSTLGFGAKTQISFTVITTKVYPSLTIGISRLGLGFRSPSERMFAVSSIIKNASTEMHDAVYDATKMSMVIMAKSNEDEKDPKKKIKQTFSKIKENADKYIDTITALDIFIF